MLITTTTTKITMVLFKIIQSPIVEISIKKQKRAFKAARFLVLTF